MVKHTLTLQGDSLYVADKEYTVNRGVHIVAFGKAVLGMVRAAEDVLGEKIVGGIASVPIGMPDMLRKLNKRSVTRCLNDIFNCHFMIVVIL
jgi:glycerate kinase